MTKRYIIETTYTVKERVAIVADSEVEALEIAKSNDMAPFESVRIDRKPRTIAVEKIGR